MLPLLKSIRRIGQTQLIRRQIANLLQFECQLDAFQLHQSLLAFDRGLMNDITGHYRNPEKPYPDPATGNPLLFETTSLLEACGLDNPLHKIYVTSDPLEGLPQLLFLFLLTYIPKVLPLPSLSLPLLPLTLCAVGIRCKLWYFVKTKREISFGWISTGRWHRLSPQAIPPSNHQTSDQLFGSVRSLHDPNRLSRHRERVLFLQSG
jgi:hypothetical protein